MKDYKDTSGKAYVTQSLVFIVIAFMTIIEFFWMALIITDTNPTPTNGEYYGFIIWVIAKLLFISIPVIVQRLYLFTGIICIPIWVLTSFWEVMLIGQSYYHIIYKAPRMLIACDIISILINVIIIAICLWVSIVHIKRQLMNILHIVKK